MGTINECWVPFTLPDPEIEHMEPVRGTLFIYLVDQ